MLVIARTSNSRFILTRGALSGLVETVEGGAPIRVDLMGHGRMSSEILGSFVS